MHKLASRLLLVCALFGSSCASIVTGGSDDIMITSEPDGAYFRTNLGQSGRTPTTISIPDDKPLTVSFTLDGYEEQSASVGTRLSAWVIGNIVFGGLIGLVVDVAADGKVHQSDHVHVAMYPTKPPKTVPTSNPLPSPTPQP